MKFLIAAICASLFLITPAAAYDTSSTRLGVLCNDPDAAEAFEFLYLFDRSLPSAGDSVRKIARFMSTPDRWCTPSRLSGSIETTRVDGLDGTRALLLEAYLTEDTAELDMRKVGMLGAVISPRLLARPDDVVVDIELHRFERENGTYGYFIVHRRVLLTEMAAAVSAQ